MECDAEMDGQEQAITGSNALHNDPSPGAPDPKSDPPAGQEVDDNLVALLPTSLKRKHQAIAQPTTASENLKRGRKMVESLGTILATQENLVKELEERVSTLEKSLGEKDAAIKELEVARDNYFHGKMRFVTENVKLRVSEKMYKEAHESLSEEHDQLKAEAAKLRSDLATAKQTYDKDTQDLKNKHGQAVSSASKARKDSETSHEIERQAMQQRIDQSKNEVQKLQQSISETATKHKSEMEAMQKRIDDAANTYQIEKQAMQQRVDESRNEVQKLQQVINETAAKQKRTTEDLQKRIGDTAATHKTEMEAMRERIKDDGIKHAEKVKQLQQRINETAATHDDDTAQQDSNDVDLDATPRPKKTTAKPAAAKTTLTKKRKRQAAEEESEYEEEEEEEDDDDESEEDEEEADATKPSKAKKTKKKKVAPKGRIAAAKQREERLCAGTSPAWVDFETSFFGKVGSEQILTVFNKRFPRLNYDELDVILPNPIPDTAYDKDWTVSDEAKLDKRWRNNSLRKELIEYKDSALPKLFRVMIRIFRITPFDFLSAKYQLQYEGSPSNKSQRWTTTFSQHVYRLIVHPLWDFDINLLKLAIQYAVILRTRDVRTWKFVASNNDPFFQTFKKVIQEFRGKNRPLAELHGIVRRRLREQSITMPPYSQFMRLLEKQVQVDNDIEEDVRDEDGPLEAYPVGNADLKNITDALDGMTHVGLPYFPSADVFCRYILAIRQGGTKETGKPTKAETKDDPPFGQQKTKDYIERALVAVRRFEAKEKNRKKRLGERDEVEGQDSIVQAADDLDRSVEADLRAQLADEKERSARLQRTNNQVRSDNNRLKRRISEGGGPIILSSDDDSDGLFLGRSDDDSDKRL